MQGQKKISRRELIKGAAVAGAALASAGVLTDRAQASSVKEKPASMAYQTCDVLVVGGLGWAGLITALHAAELGAKVIAIDKQAEDSDWIGGDVLISGHSIHICSNSLQLPADKLLSLINTTTEGNAEPEVAKAHANNANRAIKWLIDSTGQKFNEAAGSERQVAPNLPSPYFWGMIKPGGPNDFRKAGFYQLCHKLLSLLQAKSNAKILGKTKAIKLLTDAKGKVTGVLAQDKDGQFNISAKAVILATGGHSRNRDMMTRYFGPVGGEIAPIGWGQNQTLRSGTGEGHLMAMAVGAQVKNMAYMGATVNPEAAIRNVDLSALGFSVPTAMVVNKNGQRFADEGVASIWTNTLVKTSIYATAYYVFDSATYTASKVGLDLAAQYGATIYKAQTIAELATAAAINGALENTVKDYNTAVANKSIATASVPRTANAQPVATAPFYAMPIRIGTWGTYGGLVTDAKGAILDLDSSPIPGLYGSGTVMEGGLSGGVPTGGYVGCIGTGLIWGLISAESAAAYSKAAV